jgi:hypothetical protein
MHPFLSCKEKKIDDDNWGWEFMYHSLTRKELSKSLISIPWKPVEIDKNKYLILTVLSKVGVIETETDVQFLDFINKNKLDANKIIKELANDKLVYIDEGKIGLLIDELVTVFSDDGKVYAGENKSGEMSSYFAKQMTNKQSK